MDSTMTHLALMRIFRWSTVINNIRHDFLQWGDNELRDDPHIRPKPCVGMDTNGLVFTRVSLNRLGPD